MRSATWRIPGSGARRRFQRISSEAGERFGCLLNQRKCLRIGAYRLVSALTHLAAATRHTSTSHSRHTPRSCWHPSHKGRGALARFRFEAPELVPVDPIEPESGSAARSLPTGAGIFVATGTGHGSGHRELCPGIVAPAHFPDNTVPSSIVSRYAQRQPHRQSIRIAAQQPFRHSRRFPVILHRACSVTQVEHVRQALNARQHAQGPESLCLHGSRSSCKSVHGSKVQIREPGGLHVSEGPQASPPLRIRFAASENPRTRKRFHMIGLAPGMSRLAGRKRR